METNPDKQAPNAQQAPKVRKPYRKPEFIFERAFETMALACGKVNSSQAQCKTNKKKS